MTDALHPQLLLEHPDAPAGTPSTAHALVRLQALARTDVRRPPLDLVACIDVSGSMAGRKLDEVKRALLALAAELGREDRLGLTSFESEVARVLPLTVMNAQGKARLRAAVEGLEPRGSTYLSGGLLAATADLAAAPSPRPDAVRRVLLFTDGHANRGLPEDDRPAWAALVREGLAGCAVSWFGFGEDHDAEFLAFLADLTRGNAYVARDEDAITDAFARELGGLLGVRATELSVAVSVAGGEARLLNDERAERQRGQLVVSLDDLACEERKELVFELQLPAVAEGAPLPVRALVRWRDAVTGRLHETPLEASFTATAGFRGRGDPEVAEALALVLAANAQRQARAFAEEGRWRDAAAAIREAIERFERLDGPRAHALARQLAAFLEDYRHEARCRGRRAALLSAERALSKQRSSGSEVDELFDVDVKRQLVARFKEQPARKGRGSSGT